MNYTFRDGTIIKNICPGPFQDNIAHLHDDEGLTVEEITAKFKYMLTRKRVRQIVMWVRESDAKMAGIPVPRKPLE